MSYRVVAPLVLARDHNGSTHHCYAGAHIDWLPEDQKHLFLELGLVEKISAEKPASDPPVDGGESDGSHKPHAAATKAELIAWLVDHAVRPDGSDYTAGSLQPTNKDDLWALIDAVD